MVDSEIERTVNEELIVGQSAADEGGPDIFESRDSVDAETDHAANGESRQGTSSADDVPPELPVELASLTDR